MRYVRTNSSNIYGVSHNKRLQRLRVTFIDKGANKRRRGAVYVYEPVGDELAQQFVQAESVGKFFVTNIRNNPKLKFKKVR